MKSNASIVREIECLSDADGLWSLEESSGCANPACENHHHPAARFPRGNRKRGKCSGGQRYDCKSCGRKTLLSNPVRLHDTHQRLAADVFSRVANESPVRGSGRGVELKSMDS